MLDAKPSRKGKERENSLLDPQPTDIAERLTQLRRKNAAASKPKDRSERDRMQLAVPQPVPARSPKLSPPTRRHPSPHDADPDDFSRRLKISSSPSPRPPPVHKPVPASKLFNPNTDPIPMRRTAEPESMSDGTGSSYVHVSRAAPTTAPSVHRDERTTTTRQLFDHRKDNPVRFSVLARPQMSSGHGRPSPTPKSSGDYLSASSTSSYAASISSSTFTLSSTTDGSSTSSALFDGRPNQGPGTDDSGNTTVSLQLKRLYREISNLETKIKQEDSSEEFDDAMSTRVMLKGKEPVSEEPEKDKWLKQIRDHRELAENIHNLLQISLAPSLPASLRNIPTKYNIIVRLWTYAFHKILESLRRASFTSALALEHLQDFVYYAYGFYTVLLEEPILSTFKSGWLEALGDLARYRMAVAAMVNGGVGGQGGLTTKAVSEADADASAKQAADGETGIATPGSPESVSDAPAARIDDSPSPSIGVAAARLLDVGPEKEQWRNIARDWYGTGLAEQPGTGKLHHHLGLLSREVESEELRGVYHFVKSMTTLHPFPTSRESVLPIWSHAAQVRRSAPDARASELFVLLHGMLFTNIQLDDFQPTLARFIERLEIEGAEEREWIMMAIINVSSVLEYGRPNGVLRKIGCIGPKEVNGPQVAAAMRVMAKKAAAGVPRSSTLYGVDEERMEVDEADAPMRSPTLESNHVEDPNAIPEQPPALKFALQLTFAMLSSVLRHPTRKASQYSRSNLNPYLPVLLTFLSTVLKHKPTLDVLERSVPWDELAAFFSTIPRKIMISQGLMSPPGKSNSHRNPERWVMLTSGCPPPLPEDWCLRGMEWVGRKVYERGFWKSGEEKKAELEVLETVEGGQLTDGTIEDDDGDVGPHKSSSSSSSSGDNDLIRRYVRIARAAVNIAGTVDGFAWTDGTRAWAVEGKLAEKLKLWKEEEQLEREEEERRRLGKRWVDDAMDVDEETDSVSEESEDDENDSEDIKALKARRRYLKNLLQSEKRGSSPTRPRPARTSRKPADSRAKLPIVPGYTILVVDTNILLSSLSMVSSLIESLQWTVVVPLPVIMELDGLSANVSQLGEAAQAAMSYISSHVRSHALSLKVQTSKGNYLTSLSVRTEEVDFHGDNAEKSMDDLILKAAIWQDDHWVDRSSMLKAATASASELQTAVKVVFLSLDRNLRLKARSRQLPAASESDLAAILATAT
ncbi:hypothetical protein GALMADRAFT_71996 [Galerina marginata CBS 339.88]|uniref:PIN domain-containing protein n=1 Tax=Galerina marginata (strain CBS 339.88) TaxID=685588 RepID=A0A067SRJ7_GALM3|nr:hypothetical protein GALMADRAFT_71996 [Galerina marginata CBS 339.88]